MKEAGRSPSRPAPPTRSGGRERSRPAVAAATLACCLALLYVRKPDAFSTPQFWGEDGALFFTRAREAGVASLFEHYNGYVHLVPRAVALATAPLPPPLAPAVYDGAAVLIMLLAAAWCFSPRLCLSPRAAAACALALVLVPHSGVVFANLTNVLNVLVLPLALLVFAADPTRPSERLTDLVILAGAGLTGPWVAALTPFFLLRAAVRRTRWSIGLAVLAIASSAVQLAQLGGSRTPGELSLDDPSWVYAVGFRGAGAALLGWADGVGLELAPEGWAGRLAWGTAALYAFVLGAGAAVRSVKAVGAAAISLLFHGLVAWAYRGNPFHLATEPLDRYSYPALVALAWALVALGSRASGRVAWPARALLVLMGLSALGGFTAEKPADLGWRDACAEAFAVDVPARIAISPAGWSVRYSPADEGRAVDAAAARAALSTTLGRDVAVIRPTDATPTRLWTGDRWVTGLPVGAGCVFDLPTEVTSVDFELWIVGPPTRADAWTQLVVATVADPDEPEVVDIERIELAPRVGEPGPERRHVTLPADRTTRHVGVGAYGGEGGGAWYVAWRVLAAE